MYVGWGIKLPPPATTDRQHGSSLHRDLILVAKSGESKPHVEVGAGKEAKRKPMPDSGASTQHGITLLMRGVSWLLVKSEYRAAAGVSRVEIAFCRAPLAFGSSDGRPGSCEMDAYYLTAQTDGRAATLPGTV